MQKMKLKQLLTWYVDTPAFRNLADNSQKSYIQMMGKGSTILGPGTDILKIDYQVADDMYAALLKRYSKHAAVSVCRIMRRVWNVARRKKFVRDNPFAAMSLSGLDRRKVKWSRDQLDQFVAGCDTDGFHSLGLLARLCYTFVQRPGDMRQLQWANIKNEWITEPDGIDPETGEAITGITREIGYLEFDQEKGHRQASTFMRLRIPDKLFEELMLMRRLGPYICTREDTRRAYSTRDYNLLFVEIKARHGIPSHLQLRDLRRTGVTQMLENHATDAEAMSMTGHKDAKTLRIYEVITDTIIDNAMDIRMRGA